MLMVFRDLTKKENKEFRQWAIDNDPPNPEIWECYHPVCREVWMKRGIISTDAALAACLDILTAVKVGVPVDDDLIVNFEGLIKAL